MTIRQLTALAQDMRTILNNGCRENVHRRLSTGLNIMLVRLPRGYSLTFWQIGAYIDSEDAAIIAQAFNVPIAVDPKLFSTEKFLGRAYGRTYVWTEEDEVTA